MPKDDYLKRFTTPVSEIAKNNKQPNYSLIIDLYHQLKSNRENRILGLSTLLNQNFKLQNTVYNLNLCFKIKYLQIPSKMSKEYMSTCQE